MKLVTLRQMAKRVQKGGRLIGLDVGTRNVGVAVSDHQCRVASPLCVFRRNQSRNLENIDMLNSLVGTHSVVGLAVGYPLTLGGRRNSQEYMVKSLVSELKMSGKFPNLLYLYWDERLTSAAVESMLRSLKIQQHHYMALKDKMAALSDNWITSSVVHLVKSFEVKSA